MQCESRHFGHSGCHRRYPATTVTAKNQRQTPTSDTNSRHQQQTATPKTTNGKHQRKPPTETSNRHRQRTPPIDTTNKIQTVNTDSSHCQNPHTLIIGQQTAATEPQTGDAHSEKTSGHDFTESCALHAPNYILSISRRKSFSFMEARLSYSFFPRARAIRSFA